MDVPFSVWCSTYFHTIERRETFVRVTYVIGKLCNSPTTVVERGDFFFSTAVVFVLGFFFVDCVCPYEMGPLEVAVRHTHLFHLITILKELGGVSCRGCVMFAVHLRTVC